MRRSLNGYFTVEAAMVFPMVLMAIVLIIYLLFYQHARCLMEQDAGILALDGALMQMKEEQERIARMRNRLREMDAGRYLAWESGETVCGVTGGKVYVEQSGGVRFPFRTGVDQIDGMWSAGVRYENRILDPVFFIRNYRRAAERR